MLELKSVTKKVVEQVPGTTKLLLKPIPQPVLQAAITFWLNRVFQPSIQDRQLDFLKNKFATIAVVDIDLVFSVTLSNNRLKISWNRPNPDVTFKANLNSLILLMTGKADPDTLFFRRQLTLLGDTELGLALKNFLDTLDSEALLPPGLYRVIDRMGEETV